MKELDLAISYFQKTSELSNVVAQLFTAVRSRQYEWAMNLHFEFLMIRDEAKEIESALYKIASTHHQFSFERQLVAVLEGLKLDPLFVSHQLLARL